MRPLLVLLFATLPACDGGILTILDKDPADLFDSFAHDDTDDAHTDDADKESAAPGDTADTGAAVIDHVEPPTVRCVDMGDGRHDRIVTAIVPVPAALDWTRVLPPRVLVWRAEETCWAGDAAWTTGTEGAAGAHPDGSPGATYTLTVSTLGIACDVDLPITLAWTAELRTGDPTVYAATGDTEPRCT